MHLSTKRLATLNIVIAFGIVVSMLFSSDAITKPLLAQNKAAPAGMPTAKELFPFTSAIEKTKSLHKKKAKPESGDWLEKHKEPGQTFKQYILVNPKRRERKQTTIYVQPLGSFTDKQKKLLAETTELLGIYYNVPVKTQDELPLDKISADAQRKNPISGDDQILTTYLLEKILPAHRPDDAIAVLGLTSTDLWAGEGWNFVFGQASLTERVGVWSSARYGDPDATDDSYKRCQLRTFKVAVHETGHMLGIRHCIAYECGMNGSNGLDETDRGTLCFCPECSAKICWACKADPAKWYGRLAEFAKKHELKDEAAQWQKLSEQAAK